MIGNGVQVEEVMLGEPIKELPEGWTVEQDKYGNWEVRNDKGVSVTTPQKTKDAALSVVPKSELPTKFSSYVLHGGANYRELLLTLPYKNISKGQLSVVEQRKDGGFDADINWLPVAGEKTGKWIIVDRNGEQLPGAFDSEKDAEVYADSIRISEKIKTEFRSSHYDTPNIIAHIRLNERTDAEGKQVLFVEEIQSDLGQKGKKEGFAEKITKWTVEFNNGAVVYYLSEAKAKEMAIKNNGTATKPLKSKVFLMLLALTKPSKDMTKEEVARFQELFYREEEDAKKLPSPSSPIQNHGQHSR